MVVQATAYSSIQEAQARLAEASQRMVRLTEAEKEAQLEARVDGFLTERNPGQTLDGTGIVFLDAGLFEHLKNPERLINRYRKAGWTVEHIGPEETDGNCYIFRTPEAAKKLPYDA